MGESKGSELQVLQTHVRPSPEGGLLYVLHHFNMAQQFKVVIGFVLVTPSSYYSTAKRRIDSLMAHVPYCRAQPPQDQTPLLAVISHVPFPGFSVF